MLGQGRPPGEGNGSPFQKSCLENPRDREAWQATVHGVTRVRHVLATKPILLPGKSHGEEPGKLPTTGSQKSERTQRLNNNNSDQNTRDLKREKDLSSTKDNIIQNENSLWVSQNRQDLGSKWSWGHWVNLGESAEANAITSTLSVHWTI